MKFLPLPFIGIAGCAAHTDPLAAPADRPSPAAISTTANPDDHRRFVEAILGSANLETDLPSKVAGTPYRMEYFSMSAVAPEIFQIVARDPRDRDRWTALAKVSALGAGEYARAYNASEAAAKREFPDIFFHACPNWDSLVHRVSREMFDASSPAD